MAFLQDSDSQVFQMFWSTDGNTLGRLQSHICAKTGEHYVLWSDVQDAFEDVDHLRNQEKKNLFCS